MSLFYLQPSIISPITGPANVEVPSTALNYDMATLGIRFFPRVFFFIPWAVTRACEFSPI